MTTQVKSKRFRLRRTSSAQDNVTTPPDRPSQDMSSRNSPFMAPAQIYDAELADEDNPDTSVPPAEAGAERVAVAPVQIRKEPRTVPANPVAAKALTLGTPPKAAEVGASSRQAGRSDPDKPERARDAKPVAKTVEPAEKPAQDQTTSTDLEGTPKVLDTIDSIRAEGLTARQLRMAMRVAQKHGLRPTSAHDAVLMLRERGIDPFARGKMLDLVATDDPEPSRALTTRPESAPAMREESSDPVSVAKERMARLAADREKELRKVQRDIARRRRKRLLHLGARLLVFVTLPTFIATWYFYVIATPMYATESQFVIQQADGGAPGDLSSMLPSAAGMGLGGQNEAASVQSYLQSRAAMQRLNQEEGFKDHFIDERIDLLRRLPADATDEAAFRLFKRHVLIGYDPTEGVVRLEAIAASPEDSERFSRALIRFAEEHVDMMTQRLRDSQMTEARQSLEDAQQKLIEARLAVVDLQERSAVMSGEVELSLLSQQIGALEAELTQTRLSLQEIRSNPRPNPARLQPLERREEALRAQIETLRGSMTRDSSDGVSLARTQSQLIMAEAEVQTREMMRAQAMQQLESARIEVSRQVRYLALSVEPVAPDEPTYPRKLENSALAFLIFFGIYLFVSMTGSVLREQISG
ncbi:MAG: capsule biosynthesis protein [Natronohydrobacter sp.]|nr:capsule biosynthesis protein [Natronohydrobacter sp.]